VKRISCCTHAALATLLLGPVAACGSSAAATPDGLDAGPLVGEVLPFVGGNSWTYRVTDNGEVTTKITTIGDAAEPVGGTGPHQDAMAFKVITKKGEDSMDQTISWQAPMGDKVIRYREQSFSASTGELELEEHWDPYKLHIDGSAEHRVAGAVWIEDYFETKIPTGKEPTTAEQRDPWTVDIPRQMVTVPAGTFEAIVFQKAGGSSLKTYWYVPGVGKVKETGGQTEELVSYHVAKAP